MDPNSRGIGWMGVLLISVLSNLIVKALTESSSSVRVTATKQSDGSVVAIATRN